ncbi:MAG: GHKL domain-containing protein [Pirellulales bacterium]|nr:GHKL domain-containing protein [Pirellulales bacterium]
MKSLRVRLLVGMIGSFALLLTVFGLAIDASIEYMLVREFDFYLETVVRTLAAAADRDAAGIHVKTVPEALPDIQAVEGELFSEYWSGNGSVLARSANLAGRDLPRFHGQGNQPQVRPLVLPDGRHARAAGVRFELPLDGRNRQATLAGPPEDGGHLTLVVARDTTDMQSHIRQLRWLLLAAGAATMIAGATVSVAVIRRSLAPLSRLAGTIATIQEDDLRARIPADSMPEEIVPVVHRLNELLGRLEHAFVQERSLTADIAHELRTPVAGILSTAGVALASPRAAVEYREAIGDVLGIARQMRSMIENLLMLARLESETARFRLEPVPLRAVVQACWETCREQAAAGKLTFENGVPEELVCVSDRSALGMVLANLLENAAEYADAGGRISAAARIADGILKIEVANTGCCLSDEEVGRVFDRFWRADRSRHATGLHCGLGLPLVRRISTALDGSATAWARDGVFTVRVTLPSREPRTAEC